MIDVFFVKPKFWCSQSTSLVPLYVYFQGAALVLLVTITSTSTGSTQPRHAEGSVAALRASAGRCERFVRVRVTLAQGVGSTSQVLEGLMAGRERLVRVVRLGWRSGRAALSRRIGLWGVQGCC
jgi:hypothetical protein